MGTGVAVAELEEELFALSPQQEYVLRRHLFA